MYNNTLIHDDCIIAMNKLPEASFDAIVTDPPYELGFLGRAWDKTGVAFRPETWARCLHVAKPGAHLLAFGGSRTFHRLATAIESAGWEIRDCIMWLYGSGYPKSLNLAGRWQGFGTGLKPAFEPIVVARKPLAGKVMDNMLKYGCGALNIDACRVPAETATGWKGNPSKGYSGGLSKAELGRRPVLGRWPANIIHDSSAEVLRHFPVDRVTRMKTPSEPVLSPARFFYSAKASAADRDEGLSSLPINLSPIFDKKDTRPAARRNIHPTVKPTQLMRYLVRLVTPPGGCILDPFAGSGSTGKAAILEGFGFVGIEKEAAYAKIARARMTFAEEVRAHAAIPAGA